MADCVFCEDDAPALPVILSEVEGYRSLEFTKRTPCDCGMVEQIQPPMKLSFDCARPHCKDDRKNPISNSAKASLSGHGMFRALFCCHSSSGAGATVVERRKLFPDDRPCQLPLREKPWRFQRRSMPCRGLRATWRPPAGTVHASTGVPQTTGHVRNPRMPRTSSARLPASLRRSCWNDRNTFYAQTATR